MQTNNGKQQVDNTMWIYHQISIKISYYIKYYMQKQQPQPASIHQKPEEEDSNDPHEPTGTLKKCGIQEGCEFIENYKKLNRIHEGTYGIVYRALEIPTGNIVAIKKLKMENDNTFPITSLREISIVRSLNHPNIMNIYRVAISPCKTKVYIIMEYLEHQIKDLLLITKFTEPEVKKLMKDLLEGISYLHSRLIVHRDLKSSNLLYSNEGVLKICDFGLARKLANSSDNLTKQVITMWYRPPELLLQANKYSIQVDIWSIGCIFAELILRSPLWRGNTVIQQLQGIFKTIGSPTQQTWPEFRSHRLAPMMLGKKSIGNKLRQMIPKGQFGLSNQGVNLLSQMLTLNPSKRITAKKALYHPWFIELPGIKTSQQMPKFPPRNQIQRVKNQLQH